MTMLKKLRGEHDPDFVVSLKNVYYIIYDNISVFIGSALSAYAVLSFSHGRECDGLPNTHVACTNPAVYYEYPLFSILLFTFGVVCITFWLVKRDTLKNFK
jgi:hypothetical protein